MAGSVKGIIVEIGGDTSGLQKALSKVNSATSSLSKELKGINSLLKLDPKNTELLSQKQTVLNNSIKTTEDKLKQLKDIKEKADQAMASGTQINEENYRALQREIINTQNKLSDLKNESSNWTKAGDQLIKWGENLDKISSKLDNLGNKLTTRLTVPIVGTFATATKEAIEFESAFTGVTKTVDGTEEQLENLKQGIKDLAKEIPSSTTEIAAVAEAAGQLGIQTDNILSFSKAMIDLGNSTNLTSEEAASQLAKFANIMQMSQTDFDKLGSAIVDLGNNFATTEADIVNMAMRLAGAGKQVGLSEGEVLGLSTALSSVGIEAEMGGSAISKAMVKMQNAVELGGGKLNTVLGKTGKSLRDLELLSANNSKDFKELCDSIGMTSTEVKQLITAGTNLEDFAKVSGMTSEQFKKAWQEDAVGALTTFIKGLGDAESKGESAITMLSEMGLTEVRLRDSLLRAANAGDLLNTAVETGTKAFEDNVALTKEANKRYATMESKLKITKNKIKDVAVSLGDKLLPSINKILEKADKWIKKLDNLSDAQKDNIVKIGLMVAAAGPLLKIGSSAISIIRNVSKGIGTFSKAISLAHNGIGTATGSAATLAKVLQGLTSPAGIAAVGITTIVAVMIEELERAEAETRKSFSNMGSSASDFITGIDSAVSHLDSFNNTLFASTEEQQELQEQMREIQEGITKICKTASDERRDYTQEEITQLDEYFTKLRELKNREIEIQSQIAGAITQQALTNAETFKDSLEEYKVQSQEWIKTAQEQANKTISIIEQGSIEEVALLNQRYGEQATMQNQAYATEYNNLMTQKQQKIDLANEEVAEVIEAYSNGYTERLNTQDLMTKKIKTNLAVADLSIEDENQRHIDRLNYIQNEWHFDEKNRQKSIEQENETHQKRLNEIWASIVKNMSDSEQKQLGVWLGLQAQSELYGNEIDEQTKKIVNSIIDSYDSMPKKTKEAMKNAMQPMLEEMQKQEPSLYAKASNIANGILNRLKKSFDIHSPSRKTRKIFNQVMQGSELGLEDEKSSLYKKVEQISSGLLDKFKSLTLGEINMGNLKNNIIDSTKTIFTTPQITFNVQKLGESELQQCFNYINRKFGSQY